MIDWCLRKLVLSLAACLMASSIAMPCAAQETPPPTNLEFQRVYVPENRSKEWPRTGFEFAPQMKLDDFEQLIRQFSQQQDDRKQDLPLQSLTYRASLDGRILQGTAQFTMAANQDAGPGFVSLGESNLFYFDQTERLSPMPNLWVGGSGDRSGVFLQRPQENFTLDWSYQASARTQQELNVVLQLPFAPKIDFYLDLPADWEVVLGEGVMLASPEKEEGEAPVLEETRQWHLSPQWQGRLSFKMIASDRLFQTDAAIATQSTRYIVQDNLCEVTAQVSLQSPPAATLDLTIPAELTVTQATVNGETVDSLDLQQTSDQQQILRLPQALFTMGETAAVSVQGLAPISIRDYSRIDLPIISVTSQPTESHVVAVQLDEGINLSYCSLKNAQQVDFVPHNSLGRSNLKFRLFDETAQIGLQLFRRHEPLRTALVHKTTVNDLVIQSESVIRILEGGLTTDYIEIPLSPGWQAESIVQFPSGSSVRWEETTRDEQRVLRIENSPEPTDLQIELRRTRENDFGNLKVADFRPFAFPPGIGNIEWVSVKPAPGFDLQLEPEGLVARKPIADAPSDIKRMFGSKWTIPAFEIRGRSDVQHLMRVTRKRATYEAEIDVQIQATESNTQQQAAIRLSGTGLIPETVFVWSTQPWTPEVKWTTTELAPIRWTAITTSSGDNASQREPYSIYELHLPSDSAFPLTLRGQFPESNQRFDAPLLLAVPSSDSQSGTLTMTTPQSCHLTVDPILMRKVYLDSPSPSQSEDVTRLEYRPDEIRRLAENIDDLVFCDWSGTQPLPGVFATTADHTLSIENNGTQRMNSVWNIVTQDATKATFTLPADATVDLVQWQDEPWSHWKQTGDIVEVEIPESSVSASLELHYHVSPGPIRLLRGVTPSFAVSQFPTSTEHEHLALGSRLDRIQYPSPRWSTFGRRMQQGLWSGLFQAALLSMEEADQAAQIDTVPLPQGTLWIVHRVSLSLTAIAILLIVFFAGLYGFAQFPRPFFIALFVIVAITPWLPDAMAPLTSAGFLGIVLGGIGAFLRIPFSQSPPNYTTGSTVTVTSMSLLLAVSLVTETIAPASAQETAKSNVVYPVLIPMGPDRKPIGQAYLPLPLYERLNALSDKPQGALPQSIVEGMRYEITLIDSVQPATEIAVTTHIEVVTLKTNQTVRIPFDAQLGTELSTAVDQLSTSTDSGSILPNPFDTTTSELVLPLKEMGRHTVVIKSSLPVISSGSMPLSLHIETPSHISTAVTIADSMKMGSPKIEFANREVSIEASNIRQTIPLGGVPGFDLKWKSPELQTKFEFRELDLLEFNEDDVNLRVRLDLTSRPQEMGPILLAVDSRLSLDMPETLNWTAEVQSTSVSASTRTYAISLAEKETPIESIDLRFSLEGAQLVGQLRFPNIEVLNGSLQRRWVAVSAISQLQVQSQAQSRVSILSQDEFLRDWGEESPNFRFAVAVATMEPLDWLISTRPIATRGNADLRYRLDFDADGYNFELKAQIETYSGQAKQYVVQMMPDCDVDSVQYLVDGLLRPIQWHYDRDSGELGVLLLSNVSGLQELSIDGRCWRSTESMNVTIDPIKIREVHTQSCRVQVARDHAVLIRSPRSSNLVPLQEESAESTEEELVTVGQWQLVDPDQPTVWQVLPNNVVISSDLLTIVNRKSGIWKLKWVGTLDIRSGSVGSLQWLVPKEIELDIDSIEDFHVESRLLPDDSGYVYTLVPKSPLPGLSEFEWTGTLKTLPGRRLAFSPIRLIGQHRVSQWVAVPREVDDQEVLWYSQALNPTTASLRWLTANTPESHQLLSATRPDYRCEMFQRSNPTGKPSITSMETTIQVDTRKHAFGLTRVSVMPQGNPSIDFKLPSSVEILAVGVDFARQHHVEKNDDTITIPLKSNSLPQVVEIAFRTELTSLPDQLQQFQRPTPDFSSNVEEMLRVALPPQWTLEGTPHLDRMVWHRDQILTAFDLKDASRDTQSGIGSLEIQRWNKLRIEQAFAVLTQYQELLRKRGETPEQTRDIIRQLLGDNAAEVESWSVSDRTTGNYVPNSLAAIRDGLDDRFHYFRLSTISPTLTVRPASTRTYSYWPPLMASVLAFAAIGLMLVRHPIIDRVSHVASDWMTRNPQICGVLLGLFWWLFLPPHFIGLLIIAAVAWASLPIRSAALMTRS